MWSLRAPLSFVFVALVVVPLVAIAQTESFPAGPGSLGDLLDQFGWGAYAGIAAIVVKLAADILNTVVDTGEGSGAPTPWWRVLIRWLSLSFGKGANPPTANPGS